MINKSVFLFTLLLIVWIPLPNMQTMSKTFISLQSTPTWGITTTYLSYSTHGNIAATMDYLYKGALSTTDNGVFYSDLTNFNPTNVVFSSQGGAVCGYANFVVGCTGILTQLHITFNYSAVASWSDPYFYTDYNFGNSLPIDMTYTVLYGNQFAFISANPTPTNQAYGQITWFSSAATVISGKVHFIDPTLLPNKTYLPIVVR